MTFAPIEIKVRSDGEAPPTNRTASAYDLVRPQIAFGLLKAGLRSEAVKSKTPLAPYIC